MNPAMKRELFLHFAYWFSFFIFITVLHGTIFVGAYWLFWLGGLVGLFMPDIDHLIYALFVKPHELTSQRVDYHLKRREVWRVVQLLYDTRAERRGLVFHTVFFQLIFLVLMFLILSSSGSLFGQGLVLSFAVHLLVDQFVDLSEHGSFESWLTNSPIAMDFNKAKTYFLIVLILTLGMGFLM